MRVGQLMEPLDLLILETGLRDDAERELVELQRNSDYGRCAKETIRVLNMYVKAEREMLPLRKKRGVHPEVIAALIHKHEGMLRWLDEHQ